MPSQGSVGASGDLAPLAHIAQVLIGEGEAELEGTRYPGAEAVRRAGVQPIVLASKEGISLVNGTQAMLAVGGLQLLEAETLAEAADLICAMTIDGLRGTPRAFDPRIHQTRPFPGQIQSAANLDALSGRQRDPPVPYRLPPRAGCLFAALRASSAWRGAGFARHSPPGIRDRAELGDR